MTDGIPLGGGAYWSPDDDSGPDQLAMAAGVASFNDLTDLREMEDAMRCVSGPYGWLLAVEMARNDALREAANLARGEMAIIEARVTVAASDERAKCYALMAEREDRCPLVRA